MIMISMQQLVLKNNLLTFKYCNYILKFIVSVNLIGIIHIIFLKNNMSTLGKTKKEEQKYDFLVKVVIIGDTAVGKTNVLLRFVNQEYKMTHITTIGVDFKIKTVNVNGTRIKMQIWDTAGQQRFKTITQTYYKGAAGIVLVYSVTDRKTFVNIQSWLKQINQHHPQNISRIIVGNKSDCSDNDRQVTLQQGRAMAQKYGLKHIQTSAKDNLNIIELFNELASEIKQKLGEQSKAQRDADTSNADRDKIKLDESQKNAKNAKKQKKSCC